MADVEYPKIYFKKTNKMEFGVESNVQSFPFLHDVILLTLRVPTFVVAAENMDLLSKPFFLVCTNLKDKVYIYY